jgi:hypothetical protein
LPDAAFAPSSCNGWVWQVSRRTPDTQGSHLDLVSGTEPQASQNQGHELSALLCAREYALRKVVDNGELYHPAY